MQVQRATLLEKDFRTRTRSEQKAEAEAEVERSWERAERKERAREAAERRKAFEERRSQLRSWRGYHQANLLASQRQAIDREVYAQLEKEYPELCEAERLAKLEHEREKVRSTLLGPGEDYESLPEERRAEVDAAVEEWVTDGEALRPA